MQKLASTSARTIGDVTLFLRIIVVSRESSEPILRYGFQFSLFSRFSPLHTVMSRCRFTPHWDLITVRARQPPEVVCSVWLCSKRNLLCMRSLLHHCAFFLIKTSSLYILTRYLDTGCRSSHTIQIQIALIPGINGVFSSISFPVLKGRPTGHKHSHTNCSWKANGAVCCTIVGDSCGPIYSPDNNLRACAERIVGIWRRMNWVVCVTRQGHKGDPRIYTGATNV